MQETLQNSTAADSLIKIGPTRILLLDRGIPYDLWDTVMIMLSIVIGSLLGYGAARVARPRRLPAAPFLLALMLTTTTEIGADLVWAAIHHPPALAAISTTAPSLPKLYAKNCSARLPCIPDIPLTIRPIRFDLPITNDVVIFSTNSNPSCHRGSCVSFLPLLVKWYNTSLTVRLSVPSLHSPGCFKAGILSGGVITFNSTCKPRAAMHTRPDFPTCPYRVSPSRKRQMVDLSQLSWQPCTVDGVGVTHLNMSWWCRFSPPSGSNNVFALTWWESYLRVNNKWAISFPFPLNENWLCLSTGACMDLRPMLAINASASNGTTNVTLNSEAACVKPPYLWVFSADISFKCSNQPCFTGNCWNGSFPYAMLALRPPLMWVPFNESVWVHPVYQQDQLPMLRRKRDFGITILYRSATALCPTANPSGIRWSQGKENAGTQDGSEKVMWSIPTRGLFLKISNEFGLVDVLDESLRKKPRRFAFFPEDQGHHCIFVFVISKVAEFSFRKGLGSWGGSTGFLKPRIDVKDGSVFRLHNKQTLQKHGCSKEQELAHTSAILAGLGSIACLHCTQHQSAAVDKRRRLKSSEGNPQHTYIYLSVRSKIQEVIFASRYLRGIKELCNIASSRCQFLGLTSRAQLYNSCMIEKQLLDVAARVGAFAFLLKEFYVMDSPAGDLPSLGHVRRTSGCSRSFLLLMLPIFNPFKEISSDSG
nr:uncharacterized protein LOC111758584 [Cavia porcellus]